MFGSCSGRGNGVLQQRLQARVFEEIIDFQAYLNDYTIVVYNSRDGSSVYFEGPRAPGRNCLNLIMENHHFNVILSLTGVFATSYYCELCHAKYSRPNRHKKCPYICLSCHNNPPCDKHDTTKECHVCLRVFRSNNCFVNHVENGTCKKFQKCPVCHKHVWVEKSKHVCGVSYCTTCGKNQPSRHLC